MEDKIAGGFRLCSSSKSAARAHVAIPWAILTLYMVSLALSDWGGLLNSTVRQALVLFRLHASSRSGAARIISSSVELASSMKENTDAKLLVSIAWAYKSHNLELSSVDLHRWLGAAHTQFRLCSGSASTILHSTHNQPLASCFRFFRDHPLEWPICICVLQLVCCIICSVSVIICQTSLISVSPWSRLLWMDEIISRPTWRSVSLHFEIFFGSSMYQKDAIH